ncbi:TonB-dependent receptor [Gallaecimonas mangrovi]|uniref:TonB-dependent receptor n=1 Tax=Gallaecimonas mangrovi TaxID=2291597 RepID=UPI000E1FD327|nr:TonB-dependent receptor [Gallaecimonas mangrovi]
MKNTLRKSVLALTVSTILFSAAPVYADDPQGSLVGKVEQANGTTLAGTTITITNIETGLTRTVTSTERGEYRFPLLPIGHYKITASKSGFEQVIADKVAISVGQRANVDFTLYEQGVERIEVSGARIAAFDVSSNTKGMVVDAETLDRMPVARNQTAVALLAPGTTKGDSAFGNLASIGGSSVAENAYYVNGLNITDFRKGLGSSDVPFDFYETFQVKTGGYKAEFGRSTGGVINATTKKGSNEFHFGANTYWEPKGLHEDSPDVVNRNGTIYQKKSDIGDSSLDGNIWASGPLIKDKLFFFALYNPRDINSRRFRTDGTQEDGKTDNAFWGGRIDWYITDDVVLDVTTFSDKRDDHYVDYNYDYDTNNRGEEVGSYTEKHGGKNYIANLNANVTDNLTVHASYGVNKNESTSVAPGDNCPIAYDARDPDTLKRLGCWDNSYRGATNDERKQYRFDVGYYVDDFFGAHELKAGIDVEELTSNTVEEYSGGTYYRYVTADRNDDGVLEDEVRVQVYNNNGSFKTTSTAFYVQDTWHVTDTLTLNLGIRNESFENDNKDGKSFIKMDNQWAPRLGFAWDINGDGESKLFGSYGRYHLGVAANTNIRLAGGELYTSDYYQFNGTINEDGSPSSIGNLTESHVYGNGEVPDTRAIVDQGIEPMYQDEYILGYSLQLTDDWSMSIVGTRRDLKSTIEDMAIDAALNTYAQENGYTDFEAGGFDYYVLGNPGKDMNVYIDLDGDGNPENINLSASELGYPKSERYYNAVDLIFDRMWDGKWMFHGSYTWSQSYGNNEGSVRSDNGQDDAGLTTLFDQPGLLDGAYGYLPNDRRHQIKMFGAYALDEAFTVSANFNWQSGRPKNAFGYHPTDEFAAAYGSESFYSLGEPSPRGSQGRLPSTWTLDLGLQWQTQFSEKYDLTLRADVFNVFNNDRATEVYEIYDDEDTGGASMDPMFGQATSYQTPRYVRLSASLKF